METLNFRILNTRLHGRSAFMDVLANGENLQCYINTEVGNFTELTTLPNGSHLGCRGEYFTTRTGHYTFRIHEGDILHIPQRSLPVVQNDGDNLYNVTTDRESIRRRRYLQTILNPVERETFVTRSRLITLIRNFFVENEYLEVETPILQPIYGGAEATPFVTHFESLDMDCYMRIAPELYLRRMVIGGYDRVFEIGRNFRNEGISNRHNPEFTVIEAYAAYEDYNFSMDLVETLLGNIHTEFGTFEYGDNVIDFSTVRRISYLDSISEYYDGDISNLTDVEINDIFETHVEGNLIQPTMVYDYPASISPLSQVRLDNEDIAERFELFIGGMEIANAYSELNDVDRHVENMGSDDEEFIRALSYGMPPTTGIGIGIDRLVMVLTNRPIRDVIYFPTMRNI
jgi:lysyl-tRNA synthetase, class II